MGLSFKKLGENIINLQGSIVYSNKKQFWIVQVVLFPPGVSSEIPVTIKILPGTIIARAKKSGGLQH